MPYAFYVSVLNKRNETSVDCHYALVSYPVASRHQTKRYDSTDIVASTHDFLLQCQRNANIIRVARTQLQDCCLFQYYSNSYVDDLLKLIAERISKSFGPSIYFTGNNTCHPKKSDHSSVQQPASEIVPHSNSEDP